MFLKKLKYHFDNLMSKGTIALVAMLFLFTTSIIFFASFILSLSDNISNSFFESAWVNFMYTLDAGNLASASGNYSYLIIAFFVTLCGLFFTSTLVAIINSGIESKMTELRRGKSIVVEKNHTVILGFNTLTIHIIRELLIANENKKNKVIVILDDKNKEDMENKLLQQLPKQKHTKFVCRSGHIDDITDLEICSLDTSNSIIIASENDFQTLKSVLAITKILDNYPKSKTYITAAIKKTESIEAIKIAGKERIEVVEVKDTISKIIAHCCLHHGMSSIYTELLDYSGNEIYVEDIQEAIGFTFGEAIYRFEESILLGIVKNNIPLIKPKLDTLIEKGDKLILLAEYEGASKVSLISPVLNLQNLAKSDSYQRTTKNLLILGFNPLIHNILKEEVKYLSQNSHIKIFMPEKYKDEIDTIKPNKENSIAIDVYCKDIYKRSVLEEILEDNIDNILILSDSTLDPVLADEQTMYLLILLRDITKIRQLTFSLTSEILDVKNQHLISSTIPTDFVVSNYITALLSTQISQTRELSKIFEELLEDNLCEIYIKPANRYVELNTLVNGHILTAAAMRYDEIFIGYKKYMENGKYKIILNPPKKDSISFNKNDSIIVISEDD